ncbi:MAG: hypothetical protein GXX92_05020 [Clostridiales bacterium]|nr:hypothetical protein [Clostridiales bacterium]
MGLFDKLLGRKNPEENSPSAGLIKANQETSLSDQSSIEKAIAERGTAIILDKCIKVPFADVTALGTAFSQMIPSLRTISMNGVGYLPFNMEAGSVLKMAKDGTNWGAYIARNGSSKFVKWVQAGPASVQMPINPGMIMVAVMLANIEKKLDAIQDTQLKILSFLEQDKQAEQQGNLNVLTDILNGYKHNWSNDQYLRNHHMKVLDIKQASEKNIIFYQEQIASAIKKLPTVHLDQVVNAAITDLGKMISNYRMSLYLFSFSSFLEVMLLGNFQQEYLEQVASKVQKYNEHYQIQFSKCHDMLKKFSAESVEKKVLEGIGNASKALGKLIASTPFLAQGPVDEWLQDSGDRLLKDNDEKISKAMAMFTAEEQIGSELFADSIKNVGMISNKTTDIMFDGDALYLEVE